MKPQKQLLQHDPARGVYGDCVRTVIASMLDTDAALVPHFFDKGQSGEDAWGAIEQYLATHNLAPVHIPVSGEISLDQLLSMFGQTNPDVYYIVVGRSPIANHYVIACNNEIVSDPSWANAGLIGPHSDGDWSIILFVPLRMKRAT